MTALSFRKLQNTTLAALAISAISSAHGATLFVSSTNDSGAGTLRAQVAAANPGDIIIFQTSAPIILSNGPIVISNNITIDGNPAVTSVPISGNNNSRIFQISAHATVSLKGLSILNGLASADFGGGVKNDGNLTVSNCSFLNNTARGGDGVSCGNQQPNSGGGGGGGAGLGGAIFSDGPALTVASCLFSNNIAQGGHGGAGGDPLGGANGGDGGGPNGGAPGTTPPFAFEPASSGSRGGFGGGGGGGSCPTENSSPGFGGAGGFGGGGGGIGAATDSTIYPGAPGGSFGGAGGSSAGSDDVSTGGGGGAGLGGALFTTTGAIYITNCTFRGNAANQGLGGTNGDAHPFSTWLGANGTGYGGALFNISPNFVMANNSFIANIASSGLNNFFFPPQLMMTQTNGNLQFSWTALLPGFSVQFTTNTSPPRVWRALSSPITTNGSVLSQTSSGTPGTAAFFMLVYSNP